MFRTSSEEKAKLVFQIGTADPQLALLAAQKVFVLPCAIQLITWSNALTAPRMFPPLTSTAAALRSFRFKGGWGPHCFPTQTACKVFDSSLLLILLACSKFFQILSTLVRQSGLPVSCKIRLLETETKTIELCRMIESTGVQALTVHCRYVHERPKDPAHWDAFRAIVSALRIPVIGNGDMFEYEDFDKAREQSGIQSVMYARAAQCNPSSVFRAAGPLALDQVIADYIKKVSLLSHAHRSMWLIFVA